MQVENIYCVIYLFITRRQNYIHILGFLAAGGVHSWHNHSFVFVQMNVRTFKCTSYKREIWNFNNVDFPGLNIAVLGIDWFSLFDSEFDIDNVYNTWVAQFHAIIEKYIPRKTVTIRPRDKPWMNGIVRRAIRRRNRLLRIHNKKRTELSWENYRCQ